MQGERERDLVWYIKEFNMADHIRLARHRIRKFVRLHSLVAATGTTWSELPMLRATSLAATCFLTANVLHAASCSFAFCWSKEGVINQFFCVHHWMDLQYFYQTRRWNETDQQ